MDAESIQEHTGHGVGRARVLFIINMFLSDCPCKFDESSLSHLGLTEVREVCPARQV